MISPWIRKALEINIEAKKKQLCRRAKRIKADAHRKIVDVEDLADPLENR